jgi:outer membrane translocation and assembly module TamA
MVAIAILSVICLTAEGGEPPPVEEICARFTLRGKLEPALTDTEKKLICGDKGAWKTLPFTQARFNIKNFLQDRGYLHPVFIQDQMPSQEELAKAETNAPPRVAGHFTVEVGQPLRAASLTAVGAPAELKLERKRRIVGEILTPKLLGTVEAWVSGRLAALGYPCPKSVTEADPDSGAIVVKVETGPLQNLMSILEEPIPGVSQGIIRRYDAFRLGEIYNGDLLTITTNRITSLNLLQANYFTTTCEKEGAVAHQEITAGPPRLLTFGAGIDTEGLVQLRASWRNARVGNKASFAQAQAQFSTKEQQVNFLYNWYHLPYPSRRYLQPSYRLQHLNHNAYEIIQTRAALQMATSYDRTPLGLEFFAGPVIELIRTLRGSGSLNPNSHFVQLELSARMRSHSFEYWATDPRAGYSAQIVTDFADKDLGSTTSAQRVTLSGEALYNFREYDPPYLVFGLRGGIQTTFSPERPGPSSLLPANYFWYLGGSTDLRGFSLQSVPGAGAMTSFFVDPELRFTDLPLFGVQPFIFVDLGMVGVSPVDFDSPLLYSPGFGLRYKSPVGVFRTTLARGFPLDVPGGWNFYFSFGEEF